MVRNRKSIPSPKLLPAILASVLICHALGQRADADTQPQHEPLALRYGSIDPPVVAQYDITTRFTTSIHPLDPAPVPLECSSVCWAADRLVLGSDRHAHVIFTLPLALDRPTLEPALPEPQQLIRTERFLLDDLEAMTARRHGEDWSIYAMCSMSNDTDGARRAKRQHFARFGMDDDGKIVTASLRVLNTQSVRDALQSHFEALRVQDYESFDTSQNRNTPRWGNVEGIAWVPGGDTLLCGMRTPLAGSDAMLFTLEGVEQAFDREDPALLRVTDLFRLDLGGRGVTDLCWDELTRGYLITAGLSNGPKLSENQPYPLENLDSALYWWSGQKADKPRLIAKISGLNIDGVCRIGSGPYIVLTSDEGDVSEGRQGRQSVMMVLAYPYPPAGGPR